MIENFCSRLEGIKNAITLVPIRSTIDPVRTKNLHILLDDMQSYKRTFDKKIKEETEARKMYKRYSGKRYVRSYTRRA